MKKLPDITSDELMKEIDSLRSEFHYNKKMLSDEQLKLLIYARASNKPVQWLKLEELARTKNWIVYTTESLKKEYKRALEKFGGKT